MAEDSIKPREGGDNLEGYRTRRKSDVVSNLLELSRSIEPLTILFNSGKDSFPTSIIGLIDENQTVVFERSSSEEATKKLLSAGKGSVIGQPEGIKLRFALENIEAAEHEGEKVLVAPLPTEHYRMQRRRHFRIDALVREPITLTYTPPDSDEALVLGVGNLSSGGLRLDDVDHVLDCKIRQVLKDCTLAFRGVEPFPVDLQVRYFYEKTRPNGKSVHHIGCMFESLTADHERAIQNYINDLQRAQRAMAQ